MIAEQSYLVCVSHLRFVAALPRVLPKNPQVQNTVPPSQTGRAREIRCHYNPHAVKRRRGCWLARICCSGKCEAVETDICYYSWYPPHHNNNPELCLKWPCVGRVYIWIIYQYLDMS